MPSPSPHSAQDHDHDHSELMSAFEEIDHMHSHLSLAAQLALSEALSPPSPNLPPPPPEPLQTALTEALETPLPLVTPVSHSPKTPLLKHDLRIEDDTEVDVFAAQRHPEKSLADVYSPLHLHDPSSSAAHMEAVQVEDQPVHSDSDPTPPAPLRRESTMSLHVPKTLQGFIWGLFGFEDAKEEPGEEVHKPPMSPRRQDSVSGVVREEKRSFLSRPKSMNIDLAAFQEYEYTDECIEKVPPVKTLEQLNEDEKKERVGDAHSPTSPINAETNEKNNTIADSVTSPRNSQSFGRTPLSPGSSEKRFSLLWRAALLAAPMLVGGSAHKHDPTLPSLNEGRTPSGEHTYGEEDAKLLATSRWSTLLEHMKPPPVQLLGRETQTEAILKEPLAEKLRAHMPPLLREGSKWRLIYSMDQHGISMHTLYENGMRQSNLADYGRMSSSTLLVIRDDELNVFGAFGTDVLKLHVGYFGTGECFLWKLDQLRSSTDQNRTPALTDSSALSASPVHDEGLMVFGTSLPQEPSVPTPQMEHSHEAAAEKPTTEDDQAISVFHATGANEYLMLCEPHCIAFGGGEGRFGLWIDDQLLNGHSERCATFDNERLSASADFTVLGMEIWGFEY